MFEVVVGQELMVRVPLPSAEVWAEMQALLEAIRTSRLRNGEWAGLAECHSKTRLTGTPPIRQIRKVVGTRGAWGASHQ